MLISCIMVTSMFSVAITQKTSTGKSDRRMLANQGAAEVTSLLRAYVTGCGCNPSSGSCSSFNGDCTMNLGPNTNQAGAATWYLNGAPGNSGNNIVDSQGNVYALKYGTHILSNVLPAWFEAAPYNAQVQYSVDPASQVINNRPVPQVQVTVNWNEP